MAHINIQPAFSFSHTPNVGFSHVRFLVVC